MEGVGAFEDLDYLTPYQRGCFDSCNIPWLESELEALRKIFHREVSTKPREFIRQIWYVSNAIKWLTRRRTTQQDLIHTLGQPVQITTTQ